MQRFTKFLLWILFIGYNLSSYAQSTKGRDFWFGFMDQLGASPDLKVYITSNTNTTGVISIPLQGWSQNFTVTAGVSTVITVPIAQGQTKTNNTIDTKGIHIHTQECVSVFALNYYPYTSDASVILPTDALGQEYYLQTGSENSNVTGETELLVVASQDGTQVNITPSVNTTGHSAGSTFSVTLDSGKVFQLKASGNDMSGTRVWSPNGASFALFGGNMCTNLGGCTACNHLFDQMFPTTSWDTTFITVPLKNRSHSIMRVTAGTNSTQVYRNGALITTLNAGQTYQYNSSTVDYINATAPVEIGEYSIGTSCDGQYGDPFYIMQSPLVQKLRSITFNAFIASYIEHYYMNVIVPTACVSSVNLDGSNIPVSNFTAVPGNPAYSTAQYEITQGDHTISNQCGLIATVYGVGSAEAYGYSAGSNVLIPYTVTYSPDTNICPGTILNFTAAGDTSGLIYKEWIFEPDSPSIIGEVNATHTFNDFGVYTVKFVFEKEHYCAKDTVYGTVNVSDSLIWIVGDTFLCRPQSTTLEVNTSIVNVSNLSFLWNTGSTDSIINVVPQHDTAYYVDVTINNCQGRKYHHVHVLNDTARFTAPSVCVGTTTVFDNLSAVDTPNAYTWLWDFGDGNTLSSASAVHDYTDAGTYNVTLTLTSQVTGCVEDTTVPVTVIAVPNPSFTFGTACVGDSLAFTDGTTVTVPTVLVYDWDFGDGSIHSSTINPKHLYALAGTYTVSLTVFAGGSCVGSTTRTVTVHPHFSPAFAATSVCLQTSNVFTNTTDTTNGGYNIAWTWSFGDGGQSTSFHSTYLYALAGTYPVQLISNNFGCRDTVANTVNVNYKPNAAFSVNPVCQRDTLYINDASSIGGGSMSYLWNYGDGHTGVQPLHAYNNFGNITVLLTLTSDSGCVDTARNTVTVYERAKPEFTASYVCFGVPTDFTNQTNNGTFAIQGWNWNLGDGTASTSFQTSHTYIAPGDYDVLLVATTTDGCTDSVWHTATVFELPVMTVVVDSESCYQSNDAKIDLTPTAGQEPMEYVWNDAVITQDRENLASGVYSVTYTDAHTCTGTASYILISPNEIFVEVVATQQVRCFGESNGSIQINPSGGNPPYYYRWANGATTPSLNNTVAGTYELTITDADNCALDTVFYITEPNEMNISIYLSTLESDTLDIGGSAALSVAYSANTSTPSFKWSPATGLSCTDCENPVASPLQTTVYIVVMIDTNDCRVVDSVTIYVQDEHSIYVPNAFTPNGDGNNDVFNAFTTYYLSYRMSIFNRWGEKLFETTVAGDNINNNYSGWNGTYKGALQSPGVYVYDITVTYLDGKTIHKYGSVALIR